MTCGSLFSGVGGLDLGLQRAGIGISWQVEADPWRRALLARRFPHARRHDDSGTFLLDGDPSRWRVDIVAGGDPCQGNSQAGAVHRLDRPGAARDFLRVVDALRPRVVLRENPSAVRSDAPWPWHRFRAGLWAIGYAVLPFRLRACCVGAEHERDRLFLLAALPDPDGLGLPGIDGEGVEAADPGRMVGDRGRIDRRDDPPSSRFCRVSTRVPDRMDRLSALGDAVDVRVGEYLGRLIMSTFGQADARPVQNP